MKWQETRRTRGERPRREERGKRKEKGNVSNGENMEINTCEFRGGLFVGEPRQITRHCDRDLSRLHLQLGQFHPPSNTEAYVAYPVQTSSDNLFRDGTRFINGDARGKLKGLARNFIEFPVTVNACSFVHLQRQLSITDRSSWKSANYYIDRIYI